MSALNQSLKWTTILGWPFISIGGFIAGAAIGGGEAPGLILGAAFLGLLCFSLVLVLEIRSIKTVVWFGLLSLLYPLALELISFLHVPNGYEPQISSDIQFLVIAIFQMIVFWGTGKTKLGISKKYGSFQTGLTFLCCLFFCGLGVTSLYGNIVRLLQ